MAKIPNLSAIADDHIIVDAGRFVDEKAHVKVCCIPGADAKNGVILPGTGNMPF